jgi:predicted Zn-ribbon and HTH transcriptional regulator
MTALLCANYLTEFQTDVVGETLCGACYQRHWLEEQQRLQAAMAEQRRAKMQGTIAAQVNETPCVDCGYLFDHGSHGARMCPACVAEQVFDMEHVTTIASAWAWLQAKLRGRPKTIH